ncbi:MAG: alpha/beta hydrolase fold domain-containing protein [Janthinobacterium lividum]
MPVTTTTEQIKLPAPFPAITVQVFQSLPARPAPLVLHMPGGTFLQTPPHRPVARLLAEAGAVVVSADYPAGLDHPFPDAVEAMYALLRHLHDGRAYWAARRSSVFVAGEEAGGNLAAALTLMARDRLGPPIAGQILLSPMLDAGMATCSFRDAEAGPVGCKWADGWTVYLHGADKAAHPYAVPACGTRMNRLPPALVITTPDDPMRDECLAYAGRLKQAGVAISARALAAPNWPDALAQPVCPQTGPEWAGAVRTAFADFFNAVTPGLTPAPVNAEGFP